MDGKVHSIGVFDIRAAKRKGREAAILMGAALSKFYQELGFSPTLSVIEGQQIYGRGKANANDILLVALVSGAAAGASALRSHATVVPSPKAAKLATRAGFGSVCPPTTRFPAVSATCRLLAGTRNGWASP